MTNWVGADWDKEKCVVSYVINGSRTRARVSKTLDGVRAFVDSLDGDDVQVGLETGSPLWACLWRQTGATVYVFDAKQAKRFTDSLSSSGASDDKRAADALLAMVQSERHRGQATIALDDESRALARRLSTYVRLTEEKTRVVNRLTSLVGELHPAFGDVVKSVDAMWVLCVLELAPTPRAWHELETSVQATALKGVRSVNKASIITALGTDLGACTVAEEEAVRDQIRANVELLKKTRALCKHAKKAMDSAAKTHTLGQILTNIRGIGPVLTAGIFVATQHSGQRANDRDAIARTVAAAPVTVRSGTRGDRAPLVSMRRNSSRTMKQVGALLGLQLATNQTWARAQFAHYKARGKTNFAAYRRIARSFLRIVQALAKTGEDFDEQRYISQLKAKGVGWAMALENPALKPAPT